MSTTEISTIADNDELKQTIKRLKAMSGSQLTEWLYEFGDSPLHPDVRNVFIKQRGKGALMDFVSAQRDFLEPDECRSIIAQPTYVNNSYAANVQLDLVKAPHCPDDVLEHIAKRATYFDIIGRANKRLGTEDVLLSKEWEAKYRAAFDVIERAILVCNDDDFYGVQNYAGWDGWETTGTVERNQYGYRLGKPIQITLTHRFTDIEKATKAFDEYVHDRFSKIASCWESLNESDDIYDDGMRWLNDTHHHFHGFEHEERGLVEGYQQDQLAIRFEELGGDSALGFAELPGVALTHIFAPIEVTISKDALRDAFTDDLMRWSDDGAIEDDEDQEDDES